jgi:hypothetical protein
VTGEQRQHLRQLVDQRTRQLLADHPGRYCAGCGTEHQNKTYGCKTCDDRHRRWRKTRSPQNPQQKSTSNPQPALRN